MVDGIGVNGRNGLLGVVDDIRINSWNSFVWNINCKDDNSAVCKYLNLSNPDNPPNYINALAGRLSIGSLQYMRGFICMKTNDGS